MLEYIIFRLNHHPTTQKLAEFLRGEFDCIKCLPRHLVPMYFDAYINGISAYMIEVVLQRDTSDGERVLFESMAMCL